MRESLTILAVLVILVLSALLVGPYFIDWNAHRDWLAAKLSEAAGVKVEIAGPVDVKLLPRPIFRVGDLSIRGHGPGEPRVSAASLDAEVSINGLLRGDVEFVDAALAEPHVEATLRTDGSVVTPSWSVSDPTAFQFKHVSVERGSVTVLDEAGHPIWTATGIDGEGEADSLLGPFKFTGRVATEDHRLSVRLNTGNAASGRMRLRLLVDADGALARTDLDGVIGATAAANNRSPLGFDGTLAMAGELGVAAVAAPVPWRLASQVKIDVGGLTGTAVELRAGADGRALVANGAATLGFGAVPTATVQLRARQLDLDRIAVPPEVAPDTPRPTAAQWIEAVNRLLSNPGAPGNRAASVSVDLGIDAVTVGVLTLTDVAAGLDTKPGQPPRIRFAASGPNASRLAFDGAVETGAAAAFKGTVDATTRDLAAAADWLSPLAPEAADWVGARLPVHALSVKGAVELSKVGFSARDLAAEIDGSALHGSVAYTGSVGDARPRLFADLTADLLDATHLPHIGELTGLAEPLDLSLTVDTKAIKLPGTGDDALSPDAGIEAGELAFHLKKVGSAVTLDRFSIAGLGGATVTATASLDGRVATARGHVAAAQAAPLAALLQQIIPNPATSFIADHATKLSPLALDVTLDGSFDADAAFTPTRAAGEGTLGATRVSATLTPEPGARFQAPTLGLLLVADAAEASAALSQAGWSLPAGTALGPGHLEATARGGFDAGFDTALTATLPDARLTFKGFLGTGSGHGRAAINGSTPATLFRALGLASSGLPAGAWDAASDLSWGDGRLTANKVLGHLAGTTLNGTLAYGAGVATAASPVPLSQLTGSLSLDTVPAGALTSLVLGVPGGAPKGSSQWSGSPFAAPLTGLPRAGIALTIDRLALMEGTVAWGAKLNLGLAPGALTLGGLSAQLWGGKIEGSLTLRRDGPSASLAAQGVLSDVALNFPSVSGRLSGKFALAGTGSSPDALVGSLAGDTTLTLASARMPRFSPEALGKVASDLDKKSDAESAAVDDAAVRDALGRELDRSPLVLGDLSFPATVAAGAVRATGIAASSPTATTSSDATFDIRTDDLTLRTTMTAVALPKDWKGDPPQVTVTWKGPFWNPSRDVDATSFVNGLSARAIARDQERIELMQDDVRERAFFARRLRQIEAEQQAARDAAAIQKMVPAPKVPDIRLPKVPDVKPPSETPGLKTPDTTHGFGDDSLSRLLNPAPLVPVPPLKPMGTRSAPSPGKPAGVAPSSQAFEPVAPGPTVQDPTAAGRY